MPLNPFLLALPVAGIALILLVIWLTGGLKSARVDRAKALARLAEDLPDFEAGSLAVDADGRLALARATSGDELVLVFAVGNRLATRKLKPRDLRAAHLRPDPDGTRLILQTGDFARPRFELRLPEAEATPLAAWLGARPQEA